MKVSYRMKGRRRLVEESFEEREAIRKTGERKNVGGDLSRRQRANQKNGEMRTRKPTGMEKGEP